MVTLLGLCRGDAQSLGLHPLAFRMLFSAFRDHDGVPLDEFLNQVLDVARAVPIIRLAICCLAPLVLLQVHGVGRVLVYAQQALINDHVLIVVVLIFEVLKHGATGDIFGRFR